MTIQASAQAEYTKHNVKYSKLLIKYLENYNDKYNLELKRILQSYINKQNFDLINAIVSIDIEKTVDYRDENQFEINDYLFEIYYPDNEKI